MDDTKLETTILVKENPRFHPGQDVHGARGSGALTQLYN